MEVIAIIIVLLTPLAAIFGLVNIVHPLKALKITRRRQGAYIVGGSIILFLGGGLLGAASQPGGLKVEPPPSSAAQASPQKAAAASQAVRPTGMTQAEFEGMWSAAKAAMAPCDQSVGRAGTALGTGDMYETYPLVERAKSICSDATSQVRRVAIPRSAKGEVRKALEGARSTCEDAMLMKFGTMDEVAKVVNGDTRPSAVSGARDTMSMASSSTMRCALGFAVAAQKANLTLPEFAEAGVDTK